MKREDMVAGRRYRVTAEGTCHGDGERATLRIEGAPGGYRRLLEAATSIEELPEPVEVFGPGDTVRSKVAPEYIYSLAKNGYFDHAVARWREGVAHFTSRGFERVDLSKL